MTNEKQTETHLERNARILAQGAAVKRILGGTARQFLARQPKAKRPGISARAFMATFSNQGGVR